MAMYAVVVKGGKFTFTVDRDLAKGLRASERSPRNEELLITCDGAVGYDGVLTALGQLTRLRTPITDGFPYPQLFALSHVLLVCGAKEVYEWRASTGTFVLKYTAPVAGSPWEVVDFHNYIYMSNGRVAVERIATSGAYVASSVLPTAVAMCNYNGQVLIGGPNVAGEGASLMLVADPMTITTTETGSITTT
jgi:hypothetical protein